jgi:hypothetical protein
MSGTRFAAGIALLASVCCVTCASAQSTSSTTPTPVAAPTPVQASNTDYSNPAIWLCWPDRPDACSAPLDATIVQESGKLKHEAFHAMRHPPIDCFYVYPTVSAQPTGNSDLTITQAEKSVVVAQFARFGSQCRLYAPMYRQVTLTALRAGLAGNPIPVDRNLGYSDVLAAWQYYLAHENHGRGVVLVGHSQGSGVLTRLIKEEIDGKPIQKQLVSAILMGTNLPVPKGADVGGAFQHIPVCRSNKQIGCVIAFADFRANVPPPANTLFGKAPEGMQAACANPAALHGGAGKLDAYLSSRRVATPPEVSGAAQPAPWTIPEQKIDTPFVKVPGMLTAECVNNEHGSYLAVTVHPSNKGKRVNDITGDVVVGGKVQENWGLHLIDANLNMGNLVAIVGDEAGPYRAKAIR